MKAVRRFCTFPTLLMVLSSITLCSCSKGSDEQKTVAGRTQVTEQAKETVRDYARRPIERARMTQELGKDRMDAVDEAVNNPDR